jgi:hypothetical protein
VTASVEVSDHNGAISRWHASPSDIPSRSAGFKIGHESGVINKKGRGSRQDQTTSETFQHKPIRRPNSLKSPENNAA